MATDVVINKIFSAIDVDGSGSITREEMDHCFKLFDKDGNGAVSSEEWSSVFVDNFSGTAEQAAKIYRHLDQSGQGAISIQALYDLFKAMDADSSGDVSKEEFQAFWEKLLS
jgi:Ca2+-binding EF-hand superfamily protein